MILRPCYSEWGASSVTLLLPNEVKRFAAYRKPDGTDEWMYGWTDEWMNWRHRFSEAVVRSTAASSKQLQLQGEEKQRKRSRKSRGRGVGRGKGKGTGERGSGDVLKRCVVVSVAKTFAYIWPGRRLAGSRRFQRLQRLGAVLAYRDGRLGWEIRECGVADQCVWAASIANYGLALYDVFGQRMRNWRGRIRRPDRERFGHLCQVFPRLVTVLYKGAIEVTCYIY